MQSILEKACKTLNHQAVASDSLEAAREELSELSIKVANDPHTIFPVPSLPDIAVDCLTSNGTPASTMSMSSLAALKKRPRAFTNEESLPLDMKQVEWTLANAG